MFLRQLIANGRPGDVAVAISTSGTSKNICAGLARSPQARHADHRLCWATTAATSCAGKLADFALVVHCDYIPRIQEVQASIYHVFRRALAD